MIGVFLVAVLFVSGIANATEGGGQKVCSPETVGMACPIITSEENVPATGLCVWERNHWLPECVPATCMPATVGEKCVTRAGKVGMCIWEQGWFLPECM